jgi:hypothetical protein
MVRRASPPKEKRTIEVSQWISPCVNRRRKDRKEVQRYLSFRGNIDSLQMHGDWPSSPPTYIILH